MDKGKRSSQGSTHGFRDRFRALNGERHAHPIGPGRPDELVRHSRKDVGVNGRRLRNIGLVSLSRSRQAPPDAPLQLEMGWGRDRRNPINS